MLGTYKHLGAGYALTKLGALTFQSPQEAYEHYKNRSDYGALAGLLGAVGGGAYGGRLGSRKGGVPALLGAIAGATGGYYTAKLPVQFAYDVQHDTLQHARQKHLENVARLNVAAGYPTSVTPNYATVMEAKTANAALPFTFLPGAASAAYLSHRRHPGNTSQLISNTLGGSALGAGVGVLAHEGLRRFTNLSPTAIKSLMLASEVATGAAAVYADKLTNFSKLRQQLTDKPL